VKVRKKSAFYGEELLDPCPNPKLEDHPLSAVRDSLFGIFAATVSTHSFIKHCYFCLCLYGLSSWIFCNVYS